MAKTSDGLSLPGSCPWGINDSHCAVGTRGLFPTVTGPGLERTMLFLYLHDGILILGGHSDHYASTAWEASAWDSSQSAEQDSF